MELFCGAILVKLFSQKQLRTFKGVNEEFRIAQIHSLLLKFGRLNGFLFRILLLFKPVLLDSS